MVGLPITTVSVIRHVYKRLDVWNRRLSLPDSEKSRTEGLVHHPGASSD